VRPPYILKTSFSLLIAAAAVFAPALASAQADPKFAYAKADAAAEAKPVEWKAQAKGGAIVSSGNADAKSFLLGITASRKEGNNRLAIDGGLAYGRTSVVTAVVGDATMPTVATGVQRTERTTANNWFTKGRYDRFFTLNNSGYVSAQGAGDRIAGKKFFGGGQLGYSRQLLKDTMNLVVAEIGYDFSYEWYVQSPGKTLDPVSVHSARLFLGETLKVSETTGLTASAEALFNVNKEGKALNAKTGSQGVDPFKDTRLVVRAGLTTTVWKSLSVALGFTLRYDQNPAPLPPPPGFSYAANFQPFAQKVDMLTEATLIYTFL
jgi:hypothetical protein